MYRIEIFTVVTLAFLVGAAPSAALADEEAVSCTREPPGRWMTADAIATKAIAAGYPYIQKILTTGTCYEIFATTRQKRHAEVSMDPVTGEVIRAEIEN